MLGNSTAVVHSRDKWTWGGSPAYDPATGVYHLFYSAMTHACGLLHYQTNSVVQHATSRSADGPWSTTGVALAPRTAKWDSGNAHAPSVRYDPRSKLWLIFYEATNWTHGPVDCRANSSAPSVYVSHTRRIGVAASKTLDGPWRRLDAPILSPRAPPAWDASDVSNAAPYVLPNGTVLLGYRAGGDTVALGGGIGVAVAPTWAGPYARRGPSVRRMLFAAEDGAIFPSIEPATHRIRGYHMLVHRFAAIPPNGSEVAQGVGGHAFSTDGLTWRYDAAVAAYNNSVVWSQGGRGGGGVKDEDHHHSRGGSRGAALRNVAPEEEAASSTRLYRRERPQPLLDGQGRLVRLLNGAWPCHVGAETDDSHDAAVGCASFTMSTAVVG